jgi:hypothetical protein
MAHTDLDLDQLTIRLIEQGRGHETVPFIEQAVLSLVEDGHREIEFGDLGDPTVGLPPHRAHQSALHHTQASAVSGAPIPAATGYEGFMEQALGLWSEGDLEGAALLFGLALRRERTTDALFNLAAAHLELDAPDAALPLLQELATRSAGGELDPDTSLEALNLLCVCEFRLGRIDAAEAMAERAVARAGDSDTARQNLAHIHSFQKETRTRWVVCADLHPTPARLHYRIARDLVECAGHGEALWVPSMAALEEEIRAARTRYRRELYVVRCATWTPAVAEAAERQDAHVIYRARSICDLVAAHLRNPRRGPGPYAGQPLDPRLVVRLREQHELWMRVPGVLVLGPEPETGGAIGRVHRIARHLGIGVDAESAAHIAAQAGPDEEAPQPDAALTPEERARVEAIARDGHGAHEEPTALQYAAAH